MSEGVIITIQLIVQPEMADEAAAGIPRALKYAVQCKGFRSAHVHRHSHEANRFLIIEHWDSEAHFEAYQTWRGHRTDLLCSDEAILAYEYDAWPNMVAYASASAPNEPVASHL